MSVSPPVQRVVALLSDVGGYVRREVPFRIASVDFEFAAVLTNPHSLDLVVVIDTVMEPDDVLRRKLETLSTALDLVASRRPVTAVLVGPPPRAITLDALVRTGRVLVVGTPAPEEAHDAVRHALAVLLPLDIPELQDATAQSWDEMRTAMTMSPGPSLDHLVSPAHKGSRAVRNSLEAWLSEPFSREQEE